MGLKELHRKRLINLEDVAPYVSTWDTTKISTGSSGNNQIKLPLPNLSGSIYNFTVDWGDNTSNIITSYNQAEITHTYTIEGVYTLEITGVCVGFGFDNQEDKLKLKSISSWGCLQFITSYGFGTFHGCSNLVLSTVTDTPDLSKTNNDLSSLFRGCSSLVDINNSNFWDVSLVTKFLLTFSGCSNFNSDLSLWNMSSATTVQSMFNSASKFNRNIGNWDVSNIVDMYATFSNATSFNQDISDWNVSELTGANSFFKNTAFSTANLDLVYQKWSTRSVQSGVSINFGSTKYTSAGQAGRDILTGTFGWTITDGGLI